MAADQPKCVHFEQHGSGGGCQLRDGDCWSDRGVPAGQTDMSEEKLEKVWLTDCQIDEIAGRAADLAVKKLTEDAYKAVGKSIVEKMLWIVGVITVGLYLWLKEKGVVT